MSTNLKHRLIGLALLVAILVTVVPLFFFHKASTLSLRISNQMPEAPKYHEVQLDVLTKPQALGPQSPVIAKQNLSPPKDLKQISHHLLKVPEAWTLQLAAFKNKSLADRLVTALRADGYDAYLKQPDASKNALVKVYVGPQIDRAKLSNLKEDLAKRYHLTGVITKYDL